MKKKKKKKQGWHFLLTFFLFMCKEDIFLYDVRVCSYEIVL